MRNLIGQLFGKLTVISLVPEKTKPRKWLCRCECDAVVTVTTSNLRRGNSTSCGCSRRRHGMTGTKIHHVWRTMLDKCKNPNANQYKDYGGRGIKVCEEWHTFETFFADMGGAPFKGATIERIDNDKGYNKENCKWASRWEQARNKRTNRMVTAFGKTQTATDWAAEYGMPSRTLFNRLFRTGMSPEEALTVPVIPRGQPRKRIY